MLSVAKKELALTEEQYRDMLADLGATEKNGKVSATTMTIPQLEVALSHFKSCGFKPKRSKASLANFKERQIKRCEHLWHKLHQAGVMRAPYSEATLTKFAFNITKVNNIRWANSAQLSQTIEALKGMAKREAVNID